MSRRLSPLLCQVAALALLLLPCRPATAAPPSADYLFPAGAQRGQTVAIQAFGSFERWPVQVWVSGSGVEVRADKEKGKLIVTAAADAQPGTYWLRLHDDQGASPLRPFQVGIIPEILEQEPNDEPAQAQKIDLPSVTINGKLGKDGDVDCYAVQLKKGQTLVASMEAFHTLRSPMDGVLQILSSAGFVLAQNDDFHEADPQIVFTAPSAGRYLVRTFAFPALPNATIRFAGGDKFVYRLTLTTAGFIDYAYPLAVSAGQAATVELRGWNLPDSLRKLSLQPAPGSDQATLFDPQLANAVTIRVEPHPTAVRLRPASRKEPQSILLPITLSGALEHPGEIDVYSIDLKKGQQCAFGIAAHSLGFPLDPVLKMTDSSGKVLAQAEARSLGADVELAFTAPRDGPYLLEVHDFHGRGGDRFVYRLRAGLAQPDFVLKLASDRFALRTGKTLEIPITVERRHGFAGEIELAALDLPEGTNFQALEAKKDSPTLTVRLSATGPAASGPFRLVATVKGQPEPKRSARALLAEYGIATAELWLTVGPDVPEPKQAPKK